MIDIKNILGETIFYTPINVGAKGGFTLMKEDYIILPFSLDTPIDLKLGDYVDLRGVFDDALGGKLSKVYKYLSLQKPAVAPGKYDYELRLDAYYYEWNTKIFKYTPENHGQEAGWNLTATLDTQLGVFLRNLKANGYTYNGVDYDFEIDSTVENKAILMSYDNIHLLDALFSMAAEAKWNCDCWITENIIHFGRCEFGDAVKIELGVEASSMARNDSKGTYATRVYVFGGTRNIPANYRPVDEQTVVNGVVQKRLMLPAGTPYIDAYPGMTDAEAVEDVVVFDDIYPRRVGTLSDVKTVDRDIETDGEVTGTFKAYQYKDTGLVFKEEYILEGEELKVTFQSGKLNGMTFSVSFEPEGTEKGSQIWEIVANEDYGRLLPDEIMCPVNGDEYVLSGFNIQLVSDRYIPEAEKELLAKGQEYVKKTSIDDGTYPTTLDSEWVYQDQINRTYDAGQRIRLINPAFFPSDGRISRVIGWEMNLDIPYDSPVYTIGESAQYSRLGELENKVESLTYKGQTYTGSGGSGVYVIRTNDSTPASDSNVFSALRSLATFLRKDRPDQTRHLIKLLGGLISDNIESQDFASGPFGTGFIVKRDPKTGKSYIEADEIYIRLKAYFDTLEIKHLSHVGGRIVLSPAGMECIKVEEVAAEYEDLYDRAGSPLYDSGNDRLRVAMDGGERAYRCYFKQTDGERGIVNEFAVDDQAQCREFNVNTGVSHDVGNRYYWRRVIHIGDDHIDLSITDCDTGSMIPKAGDTIVTIGNKTDTNRQHVVFLSSYDEDAPCIKLYSGINSYSMLNKEVTVISPNADKNVFTGKMVIKPGSTGFENLTDAPDMGEVNEAIQDAKNTANSAHEAVAGVQGSVTSLKGYVDGAFSDGIISEAEARGIEKYVNIVNNEKISAESTFNKLYANPYLEGSAKVSLSNARSSLLSSITALTNSINSAIADGKTTVAEKADVDKKFAAFNTATSTFKTAVETANESIQSKLKGYSDKAQKAADEANNTASSAMEGVNEAKGAVSDLNKYVDGAFSDDIISEAEAKSIERYINTVNQTKKEADSTYTALYINGFLSGTAKSNLYTAKNGLNTATSDLIAAINAAIADGKTTTAEKNNVDSKFTAFNNAYASLATAIENANKAIQQKIKEEAVNESKNSANSQIGTVSTAMKEEIAKQLGYGSYSDFEAAAKRGESITEGGSINTKLINAELMITSALIASAIRTNELNVNNKFIVYTDGSVSVEGQIDSLGNDSKAELSNGYFRILRTNTSILPGYVDEAFRIAIDNSSGVPEISMVDNSNRTVSITPRGITFHQIGFTKTLTIDPSVLGGGTIKKTSDGMLYLSEDGGTKSRVEIKVSGEGTTSPLPGIHYCDKGSIVSLYAYPASGYEFEKWSDNGSQNHDVTARNDEHTYTVYFKKKSSANTYRLTLDESPSNGGTTSGEGTYSVGTNVRISATPNNGWRFVRWNDGGAQSHTVTMDGNKTLTAYFEKAVITGDEILAGTDFNSNLYVGTIKTGSGTLTANASGGKLTVASSEDFQGWVLFDKMYLGSKLLQGHRYRLSITAMSSGTTAFVAGIGYMSLKGDFNDLSSGDMIYGEQITTTAKTFTVDITPYGRDSSIIDSVCLGFVPYVYTDITITITGISLKEI